MQGIASWWIISFGNVCLYDYIYRVYYNCDGFSSRQLYSKCMLMKSEARDKHSVQFLTSILKKMYKIVLSIGWLHLGSHLIFRDFPKAFDF